MRRYAILAIVVALCRMALAQDTNIEYRSWVRLDHGLNVSKAKVGDGITARLMDDITSNGKVLVPYSKGKLLGHVVEVHKAADAKGQSTLVIAFDKVLAKGAQEFPVAGVVLAMRAPSHYMLSHGSGSVPTSGDDPMARAAGPMADSSGRAVVPAHAPLSQPGPTTAAANPSGVEGMQLRSDSSKQESEISCAGKNLRIEDWTELKVFLRSSSVKQ